MNAVWMTPTAPPMPTFSPSWVQLAVTWLGSDGLWEMPPSPAIFADHCRAIDVSWLCGARLWMPSDDRSWLVRARNSFSSSAVSAWAAEAPSTAMPPNAVSVASQTATTRKNFVLTCGGSDGDALALTGPGPNGSSVLVPVGTCTVCRRDTAVEMTRQLR